MVRELEALSGEATDALAPPLPEGVTERGPETDSPDMLVPGGGVRLLPGAVVLDYTDAAGNSSVRRATLLAVQTDGPDAAVTALCHSRGENRVFRLSGMARVLDPLDGGAPYASMAACLERFGRIGSGVDVATALAWDEIIVLMFIARSDGGMHPSERSFVIKFVTEALDRLGLSIADAWAIILRLYPDARVMRDSARSIVRENGESALEDLKKSIQAMIEADGVIDAAEALHALDVANLE